MPAPEAPERSTLADMLTRLWQLGLPLVLSAGGLAALVVGVGGAVEAARFYGAGLPAYQAVDAASQGELNVVGLTWLVIFGVLGILAVFLAYLASPQGKATPAMHYALIGIAVAEAGSVWWLGRKEGFWEEGAANLIALAGVLGAALGAVCIVRRRHRAGSTSDCLGGIPGALKQDVLHAEDKELERPLALRHLDYATLALLSVGGGIGAGLALGHLWVGVMIPFAGALGLVAIRMADLTGDAFRWYGVCVFFSVCLFGAALSVLRAVDEPRLQPVAFIVEEGNRAVAVEGVYVGESDGKLSFASVALGDCDELDVRPGSGRLWSVPREQVTHLSIGPPVGLPKLAYEATAMLDELKDARPGREATAYPHAVRDSVAVEHLASERSVPGTWVAAGTKEDLGAHPQLRLGRERLPLRLSGDEWQLRVPRDAASGPIYTTCGERTNRAWLTVLERPRAVATATALGGGSWHLNGRHSRDSDGRISEYRWTVPGKEPAGNEELDIKLPPGKRIVTATLRVTDDDGLWDEREVHLRTTARSFASHRSRRPARAEHERDAPSPALAASVVGAR